MSTQTSEAYQIQLNDPAHDHTSPNLLSNLILATVPKPTPGPGEVLVRIRAAALNFRDVLILAHSPLYPVPHIPNLTPGIDGAGEIEATGPDSKWSDSIGQGVVLLTNSSWIDGDDPSQFNVMTALGAGDVQGTLRQYAIVKDELIIKKPKNLSYEEAAQIPVAGGTAEFVLEAGKIGKGTTVLTQGTGGVSAFVIQFAAAVGARVMATSSSDEKLQHAKKLGATDLINYKTHPNWSEEVLRLTDGKGVDVVADVAGTIQQSIAAVRPGGLVFLIGIMSPQEKLDIAGSLIYTAKTLKGILGCSKVMLQRAVDLIEKYDLHPLLENIFEWKDAGSAYDALRKGNVVGKVVIRV